MTPWTVALQAPLSMGFSRQEYWSGLPFPSLGDLPDPGIKPGSPALQAVSLLSEAPGKPPDVVLVVKNPPLGGEDPLEEGMATHSSILAWEIPWQRRLVGYSPWGRKESDTTERLSTQQHQGKQCELGLTAALNLTGRIRCGGGSGEGWCCSWIHSS